MIGMGSYRGVVGFLASVALASGLAVLSGCSDPELPEIEPVCPPVTAGHAHCHALIIKERNHHPTPTPTHHPTPTPTPTDSPTPTPPPPTPTPTSTNNQTP